jgi:basic membrane protein A
MKRISLWLIVLLILSLTLSACASPTSEPVEAPGDEAADVAEDMEDDETMDDTSDEEVAAPEPIRIALITNKSVNDLGFNSTMYQSLLDLQEELGEENFEIGLSENTGPDALSALRDYASQGFDIIIAHSGVYGSAVKQMASEFPEVSFAWGPSTDNFTQAGISNVSAYRARVEDGGYVMGAMAALMTESDIIGVCGPIEASDAVKYINAFKLGVEETDPSVTVNVIYTGSFTDSTLSAAAAETLIAGGADTLTGIAAALPCMNAAQEKGLQYFAVQGDWTVLAPETVVASLDYDWSVVIRDLVATYQAGVTGGKVYLSSIENGGLELVLSDGVDIPSDVLEAADAAMQGIADGSIKLP